MKQTNKYFAVTLLLLPTLTGCSKKENERVTLRFAPIVGSVSTYASVTRVSTKAFEQDFSSANVTTTRITALNLEQGRTTVKVEALDMDSKVNGKSVSGLAKSLMAKDSALSNKERDDYSTLIDTAFRVKPEAKTLTVDNLGTGAAEVVSAVGFPKNAVGVGEKWTWVQDKENDYNMTLWFVRREKRLGVDCFLLHGAFPNGFESPQIKDNVREAVRFWVEAATGELVEMLVDRSDETTITAKKSGKVTKISTRLYSRIVRIDKRNKKPV